MDKTGKQSYCEKLLLAFSVNAFGTLMLLFFSPLEIYMGNYISFRFALGEIWWLLLGTALAVAVVVSLLEALLPWRLNLILTALAFAGGLCCYIQSAFLNGHMGSLTGEEDVYSAGLRLGNLAVWGGIVLVMGVLLVVFFCLKKTAVLKKGIIFLSVALTAMQLTAFVTSALSLDAQPKDMYLSDKGQFALAKGKNTLVFIIDSLDQSMMGEAMGLYPDMLDGLEGFTYFPNATSTHSRTFPSIPYLLTGEMAYGDVPYTDYINSAFEKSEFLPSLKARGYDIGLYTDVPYIGVSADAYVSNYVSSGDEELSVKNLLKQMGKISLYRNAPYAIKSRFKYDNAQVNAQVVPVEDVCIASDDVRFFEKLQRGGVVVTTDYDNAFRFYHFFGPHDGCSIDANGQYSTEMDFNAAIRGNFRIIQEYVADMKAAGIYEDATIIITADHGYSWPRGTAEDPLKVACPMNPVLLVKPAGAAAEPVKTSLAPVAHADLFATIAQAAGVDTAPYGGKTVFDFAEGEARQRYYYNHAFYHDVDGEVAMREYLIDGDARDYDNWSLTGKYWDIVYSERAVSKHRLSEILDATS